MVLALIERQRAEALSQTIPLTATASTLTEASGGSAAFADPGLVGGFDQHGPFHGRRQARQMRIGDRSGVSSPTTPGRPSAGCARAGPGWTG